MNKSQGRSFSWSSWKRSVEYDDRIVLGYIYRISLSIKATPRAWLTDVGDEWAKSSSKVEEMNGSKVSQHPGDFDMSLRQPHQFTNKSTSGKY